ncbi:MAG TPA: CAP domain-containing protein [Mycobacteriales bacterium]|nr:CAP domain-containing protein [Mycobacteriales bacterium]
MGLRRTTMLLIAASAMTLLPTGTAGARAHVNGFTAFDQRLLADMNGARADHGLAPLQLNDQLEPVAYSWAQHMASEQRAYDNPRFRRSMNAACSGWRRIGEAVGDAGEASADDLFNLYMRDSGGRQTILNHRFLQVGVSTVATDNNGATDFWNAVEFTDRCSG